MIFNCTQSHVSKQLIAITISGWLSLAAGFSFGYSAILLPELRNDESFPYNDDLASWIASVTPLSMVIGCVCAGSLIDGLGRKVGHILLALLSTISWLIIASASNVTLLLIGRFLAGLAAGSTRPITLVYVGEISDPKYRKFFLITPSLLLTLGILVSHIIGGYTSWKISSYLFAALYLLCLISILFLKESSLWLISGGKIDEGIQSFKWFRGNGSEAEKELNLVLQRQRKKSQRNLLKDVLSTAFIRPFLTSILLSAATQFNGLNTVMFYAKDILGNTVKGGIDPFILMIIFDIMRLLVFAQIFCCTKFISRKTFFLGTGFCCSAVLFCLFGCLSFTSVSDYVWLTITLMILYILSGGIVVALAWSFIPEVFSGNLRGFGSGLSSAMSFILLFAFVKMTLSFITNYGEKLMYACFGVITVINTIMLCFLLPETNDRTLQDIEDSYKKNNTIVSSL